jgi:hypothetical protein
MFSTKKRTQGFLLAPAWVFLAGKITSFLKVSIEKKINTYLSAIFEEKYSV